MALPALETLPPELLLRISSYLTDTTNVHLSAFSRCSRTCHEAATPIIYSTIRLRIQTPNSKTLRWSPQEIFSDQPQLINKIKHWDDLLRRRQAYHQVRSIELKDHCTTVFEPSPFMPVPNPPHHLDLLDSDDEFADPPRGSLAIPLVLKDATYPSEEEERRIWSPLAILIDHLPALSDIYFKCTRPPPGCVLRAVLRLDSSPKVHLSNFWFRGYLRDTKDTDPGELPMLLSPQVRSIRARSCGYANDGSTDYTHDGILSIASGLNSEIKHLSLLTDLEDTNLLPWMSESIGYQRNRTPWLAFNNTNATVTKQVAAKLASFEIGGTGSVYSELLQDSFRKCNMSQVTILKLRIPMTHRALIWLAGNVNLPSLKTLVLGVNERRPQENEPECGDCDFASAFLGTLPPLEALRFANDVGSNTFEVLLRKHGASLRRLWFSPPDAKNSIFFNVTRLTEIRNHCLQLEDLALPIPRSGGDANEVEIYRTLGNLPRLQNLSLALDCEDTSLDVRAEDSESIPIHPSFDDLDKEFADTWMELSHGRQARKGHIRIAMLNAALDEVLARSIFHTIKDAKPLGDRNLPFERLELRPCRGVYIVEASEVIEVIGQWWLLESNSRDEDGILATKLRYPGDIIDEKFEPAQELDPAMDAVFRKIWPGERGNSAGVKTWKLDWQSLPLAV